MWAVECHQNTLFYTWDHKIWVCFSVQIVNTITQLEILKYSSTEYLLLCFTLEPADLLTHYHCTLLSECWHVLWMFSIIIKNNKKIIIIFSLIILREHQTELNWVLLHFCILVCKQLDFKSLHNFISLHWWHAVTVIKIQSGQKMGPLCFTDRIFISPEPVCLIFGIF